MFKTSMVSALILAAGLISVQANAAFVATDWKMQGDTKATLDTETGLEWLDLNQTTGRSILDVKQLIKEGGSLFGWRLPTQNEVESLMLRFVDLQAKLIHCLHRILIRFTQPLWA